MSPQENDILLQLLEAQRQAASNMGEMRGGIMGLSDQMRGMNASINLVSDQVRQHGERLMGGSKTMHSLENQVAELKMHCMERRRRCSDEFHKLGGRLEETGRINVAAMARAEGRREFYARARHTLIQVGKLLAWTLGVISVGIGVAAALAAIGG